MPAKTRLKKIEEMNAEERAAYEKKSEAAKATYAAQLQVQDAEDRVAEIKAAQARTKTLKAEEREITKAVRDKTLSLQDAETRIRAITGGSLQNKGIQATHFPAEEATAMIERVRAAAEKGAKAPATPKAVAPTFALTHTLLNLTRAQLLAPTDGGRPDATLSSLVNQYGLVAPLLVTSDFTEPKGDAIYQILDGARRYHLIPDVKEGLPLSTVPAVLVTGFPDALTVEAVGAALNRGRSLNILRLAETISRMRAAGKNDADIRRAIGLKTGEVEKYARTLSNVPEVIRAAIERGAVSQATVLEVAKLPRAVADRLAVDYAKKLSEDADARLTEADVDEARQGATREVVARDAATLNKAAASVPNAPSGAATGSQTGASGAGGGAEASGAAARAPEAQSANATPTAAASGDAEKKLDTGAGAGVSMPASGADASSGATGQATEPPAWVEGAFEKLEASLGTLPQDVEEGVLETYRDLRAALAETFGEGADTLAAYPSEDAPPATYKPSKGAEVENTKTARPGWKPQATKAANALMGVIPADAGEKVWTAFKEYKAAVAGAKTSAE